MAIGALFSTVAHGPSDHDRGMKTRPRRRYAASWTVRVSRGRLRLVPRARSTVGPWVLLGTTDCRSLRGSTQTRLCNARAPRSAVRHRRRNGMDVIYPRCCGLDVHKREVVACVVTHRTRMGRRARTIRTFGTMTAGHPGAGRLAGGARGDPRRHGEHRGLLEADLEPAGGAASRCCWSTPGTSRRCRGARRTSATASGWPTCCGTGC